MIAKFRRALRAFQPKFYRSVSAHYNPYVTFTNYRRIWLIGIFLLIATALLPLLVVTAFHYQLIQNSIDSELILRTERVASNARRAVTFFLEEGLDALRFTVNEFGYGRLTDPDHLQEILRNLKLGFGGLTDLSVISQQGLQIAYAGPFKLEGRDYSDQQWFIQCRKQNLYISDIFRGYRDVPHVIIAVKALRNDGSYFIFRATLETERLIQILDSYKSGAYADIFIVNRQGFIQTPSAHYGDIFEKMSLPLPSYSSRTEAVISNDIGSGPIITGYAYISTQLAHTPFILMVVKQKQGMLGPWQELRSKITWFVGCGILIVILVMTLTCTYMVNRLYQADTAKAETMALMEQNNQLVSMGQLAAGVAHEINNPLALINETAGYIKDLFVIKHQYKDDKELLENIDAIIDAVDRCGTITKQLLGFTRKFDPKIQQVDLARLISEVLAFHKKEAEYRNIEVYVYVEGDISGLETDQGKLQQILVNLVNNAFQAMDDGCILEVRAAAEEADRVRLTISDNGCGMPEDTLPKIFEPFFTTKEKDQGTGLGLAITYGLVTKLHGKIAVESRENEGTTFVVTLPKQFKEEMRENESSSG